MKLKEWIQEVRGKPSREEGYVDSAAIPAEPEGPYRARLEVAAHHRASPGIDVSEREVVSGEVQVVYRIGCPCGHRWDALQFERLSVCVKCNRAVLVEQPGLPPG